MLGLLRQSRFSWRVNFSVTGRYRGRRLKVPLVLGRGFQNLQIGEAWFQKALEKVLATRDGAFIDVGVNLGQTLIKVKLVDWTRPYVGFEPNPQCNQYVSELVNLNGFAHCTIIPVGLSDRTEVVVLSTKDDAVDPSASLVPGFRPAERYTRWQHVPVFPGDVLLGDVDRIALIKIDVEGGELEVIRGLANTLRRCAPIVFCEILPIFNDTTENGAFRKLRQEQLLAIFAAQDYRTFRMLGDETVVELRSIETHGDLALTNYAFVPPAEQAAFRRLFTMSVQSAPA